MLAIKPVGEYVDVKKAVEEFWSIETEDVEPFPEQRFNSRRELTDWEYAVYLDYIYAGKVKELLIPIPTKYLGWWHFTWEGTAYFGHQIALLKTQIKPAMEFVAIHEVGHLLGLDDHFIPLNCIMAWIPWWIVPTRFRIVCPKCQGKLE